MSSALEQALEASPEYDQVMQTGTPAVFDVKIWMREGEEMR